MTSKGATLVEAVIIVSVISILTVTGLFSYQGWARRYRIESLTKELYSDLMKARVLSLQKKIRHYAVLEEKSYAIVEDSNDDGDPGDGDAMLPSFPRHTEFFVQKNGTGNMIFFQKEGLMSNSSTIRVKTSTDASELTTGADYDCMKVSATRIIMGRYDGRQCVPQ